MTVLCMWNLECYAGVPEFGGKVFGEKFTWKAKK